MRAKYIYSLLILLLMNSCNDRETSRWDQDVMNTDIEFSNYSIEHGANAAFLQFAAKEVVLLKPNMLPIVGHQNLEEFYHGKSDTAFTLKWSPEFVKVSKSGDLAYTYGFWELTEKDKPEDARKGTYLTIWKKQNDGLWKFILDTGNSGLGN